MEQPKNYAFVIIVLCISGLVQLENYLKAPALSTTPEETQLRPKGVMVAGSRKLQRRSGPLLWGEETKGWKGGGGASKLSDFVDYNGPVPRVGRIKAGGSAPGIYSGSAFAIAPNGLWITAHHVVDGCSEVLVQGGLVNGRPTDLKHAELTLHPGTDVAMIVTPNTDFDRAPFPLVEKGGMALNAFHIGFPQGAPGAVHSRYLGKTRSRRLGRQGVDEDLLVWAEVSRVPDFQVASEA